MEFNNIVCAPAQQRHREIIENNEQNIVKLMDPDSISQLLLVKGIIDLNDRRQILLRQNPTDKNRAVMDKLLIRGPKAFQSYMAALKESETQNHTKLANILSNDDPIPPALPVDKAIDDSRQKRIREKIEDHELRLMTLETSASKARNEEDLSSLQTQLERSNTELDELRQKLKTRDGQLEEAKEENRVLQRRIQSMEKKILSLEAYIKDQKVKLEIQGKKQQEDKRSIKLLQEKNAQLEHRMDLTEKKTEKKMKEQEQRLNKKMEEMMQMMREPNKHASDKNIKANFLPPNPSLRSIAANTTTNQAANGQQKQVITSKNRFQHEEHTAKVKTVAPLQPVKTWKKSTPDPSQLTVPKDGQKKQKTKPRP